MTVLILLQLFSSFALGNEAKFLEEDSNFFTELVGNENAKIYNDDSPFESPLILQQKNVIELVDGEPEYGTANYNEYAYYSFENPKESTELLFVLTTFSGDADLFVSKGSDKTPTKAECDWSSVTPQGEVILIKFDDLYFTNNHVNMKGKYIVGVFGYSPTSFTIRATSNPEVVTKLTPGQAQTGYLNSTAVNYYSYYVETKADIIISLTPISVFLVAMVKPVPFSEDIHEFLPSARDYAWSTFQSSNPNEIIISKDDPNFCKECYIVIAVEELSNSTAIRNATYSYSIMIRNDFHYIVLQNGVPFKSHLGQARWDYFQFEVGEKVDLDISVFSYSGDPDVYIGVNQTVNRENCRWFSLSRNQVEHIKISSSDSKFILGTYYIGVYAFDETSYSVVVQYRNRYIKLADGWPQTYSISNINSYPLYFEYKTSSYDSFYCQLTSLSPDFYPSVYVDFSEGKGLDFPDNTNSEFKFKEDDYDKIYNKLYMGFAPTSQKYKVHLAVFWNKTNEENETMRDFELFCASSSQFTHIKPGQTHFDILKFPVNHHKYSIETYEKSRLDIFVAPCEGSFKLDISSNWTLNYTQEPDISVSRMTDGIIRGTVNNAKGTYYITVTSLNASAWFDGISFQLSSKITKSGDLDKKPLKPGGNGIIKWTRKKHHVIVKWDEILYEDEKPYEYPANVLYEVYATEDENVQMQTACGIHTAEMMGKAEMVSRGEADKDGTVIRLRGLKAYVNVLAQIGGENNMLLRYVPYDPTQIIVTSHEPQWKRRVIIWGLVLAILFAGGIGIYFYMKYRKAQRVLQYEMGEVRETANELATINRNPSSSQKI